MKVRTCDSFTICTLVDLPLSVISTSEWVLIASKWAPLTFIGSISAKFILTFCLLTCQHSGYVYFVCQQIRSAHFVCQHKGCSRLSSPWEILREGQMEVGFEHLPQVAQSRIVCVSSRFGKVVHSCSTFSIWTCSKALYNDQFTPSGLEAYIGASGTHFTDPGRMESWVNTSRKEGHQNIQPSTRPGIEPGTTGLGGRDL